MHDRENAQYMVALLDSYILPKMVIIKTHSTQPHLVHPTPIPSTPASASLLIARMPNFSLPPQQVKGGKSVTSSKYQSKRMMGKDHLRKLTEAFHHWTGYLKGYLKGYLAIWRDESRNQLTSTPPTLLYTISRVGKKMGLNSSSLITSTSCYCQLSYPTRLQSTNNPCEHNSVTYLTFSQTIGSKIILLHDTEGQLCPCRSGKGKLYCRLLPSKLYWTLA